MISKIERVDRRAKREQVIKLASYLHQDEKEMLKLWLADKVLDISQQKEIQSLQLAFIFALRIIRIYTDYLLPQPLCISVNLRHS